MYKKSSAYEVVIWWADSGIKDYKEKWWVITRKLFKLKKGLRWEWLYEIVAERIKKRKKNIRIRVC